MSFAGPLVGANDALFHMEVPGPEGEIGGFKPHPQTKASKLQIDTHC